MQDLQDRVAVVTGAASGIGRALAERFASEGMAVVLADFERDALDAAVRELEQQEHRVLGVYTDVSQRAAVEELRDRAYREFGAVHVLCNNAGVADSARVPIWETSDDDWDWVFNINFWGVLHGIRAFVPAMVAGGEAGHVVNTASVAGLLAGNGIYGVSKHAVVALTESLYQGLRLQDLPIGASVLCPPFVRTGIFESGRNRPGGPQHESLLRDEILERALEPADIADAVVEGIRSEQLYVVPSSEFDEIFEERFDAIRKRRNWEPRTSVGQTQEAQ